MSAEAEDRQHDLAKNETREPVADRDNAGQSETASTTTAVQASEEQTGTVEHQEQTGASETQQQDELRLEAIQVDIDQLGACKRLIKIRIPAEEVDRILNAQLREFCKTAWMPGFRKGKVPPKLVLRRFRKELFEDLKHFLVGKSLQKLIEEKNLEFVDEPELDVGALNPPAQGEDFYFEFRAEVQPEFDVPNYKGLKVRRPRPIVTPELVQARARLLAEAVIPPERAEGPVQPEDLVDLTFRFKLGGRVVRELGPTEVRVLPTLRFRDAVIERFDEQISGAVTGETRTLKARIDEDAANEELRGKEVDVEVVVEGIYRFPENLLERLAEVMGLDDEEQLMEHVESLLRRELDQTAQQRVREQVMGQLLEGIDIPLDRDTVESQVSILRRRIVRRLVLMRYQAREIDRRLAALSSGLPEMTERALREFFVLRRIAKAEGIEVSQEELDEYLQELADAQGISPRRLRVQLEREGVLREIEAEVLEHLAFQRVLDYCEFEDEPWEVTVEDLMKRPVDKETVLEQVVPGQTAASAESPGGEVSTEQQESAEVEREAQQPREQDQTGEANSPEQPSA